MRQRGCSLRGLRCWYFAAPLKRGRPRASEHPLPCCVIQVNKTHEGQTNEEIIMPSGPLTSWAQDCINVFGGPIFKRPRIRQQLDSIGTNLRLILFQSRNYGVGFLLTRRPVHLACGWLPRPKCKRVRSTSCFINLFKDSYDCVPRCVESYVEGLTEFRHMQRGDFAEGRLRVMEYFLSFILPFDTQV